jgi:hypothetical protein
MASVTQNPFSAQLVTNPAFRSPLHIVAHAPRIGQHLPHIIRDPLVTQQAALGIHHGLFATALADMPEGAEPVTALEEAFAILPSDPFEAGIRFRRVRKALDVIPQDVSVPDPVRIIATFGEALWGKLDKETFKALGRVRTMAKKNADWSVVVRERLIRTTALMRIGNDEGAKSILTRMMADTKTTPTDPILIILGIIMQANLEINRVVRHAGETRHISINRLLYLLHHEVPQINAMLDADVAERFADTLSQIYLFTAEFLLEEARPVHAVELLRHAIDHFPEHAELQAMARATTEKFGRVHDTDEFPTIDNLHPLASLLSDQDSETSRVTLGDRLYAGAAELVAQGQFPNNSAFWKTAAFGSLVGAFGGALQSVLTHDGDPTLAAMLWSGLASAGLVSARKLSRGLQAPETRQAYRTGHTNHRLLPLISREGAKLVGTYAFFGGLLPLVGHLPEGLVVNAHDGMGQLHGLGEIFARVMAGVAERGHDLQQALSQYGTGGFAHFWSDWHQSSMFAEAVHNAISLTYDDPVGRIFNGQGIEHLPHWVRDFSVHSAGDLARSAFNAGLYSYMGLSGGYALASMNPTLRQWLQTRLPKNIETLLFPGAFLATGAAMMASGMDILPAFGITSVCYAVQYRHHVQSGGNWRLWKPDVFRDIDKTAMMRAGAVQLLYIGPGNAMKPVIPGLPGDAASSEMWKYFYDNMDAHFGMFPFLAMLGVFHASMTGMSVVQTLKAKYAKGVTYEIPGNTMKLMLGWTSFWGNLAGLLIKEFGLGAAVTASIREAGGAPIQRDAFKNKLSQFRRRVALESRDDHASKLRLTEGFVGDLVRDGRALHARGVKAAHAGEVEEFYADTFTRLDREEKLLAIARAYFLPADHRLMQQPRPDEADYTQVVYAVLADPRTAQESVEDYLRTLRAIASDVDPDLTDVRHNLVAATIRASASIGHGQRLRRFFKSGDGRHLLKAYDLQEAFKSVTDFPPETALWHASARGALATNGPRRWMKRHLMPPTTAPEDPYYKAAAVAGRRWPFSAPLTGRSLVENLAPVFAFVRAMSQRDPAKQTWADRTFFQGTLFHLLMTEGREAGHTTEKYRADVIQPTLDVIDRIAGRFHDERFDVRYNLLLTVWLAQNGPHGEVIQQYLKDNKHLCEMYGIYRKALEVSDPQSIPLPTTRKMRIREHRAFSQRFAQLLRDSDNSTDGKIVHPVNHWSDGTWMGPLPGPPAGARTQPVESAAKPVADEAIGA